MTEQDGDVFSQPLPTISMVQRVRQQQQQQQGQGACVRQGGQVS